MTFNGPIEIHKNDERIAWCKDPYYALKFLETIEDEIVVMRATLTIENGALSYGDIKVEVHNEDDDETTQTNEAA